MIFLAITQDGLAKALAAASGKDAVWCGADAIDADTYRTNAVQGLSRFEYSLIGSGAPGIIEGALETIAEHHPGQTIWIEAVLST
jgi:hypothetical protein